MSVDGHNPRVLELRRRVQADPASIAFAQLAEECRRSGANDEAVAIARAGLAHHPDYLSARVTLGRALVELGQFDDAHRELSVVLAAAPDNLPAIRAMAEAHQQRGLMKEALDLYRRALQLAHYDVELERAVVRMENVVEPPPPKVEIPTPSRVEDLFDFDTLLQQLGGRPSETTAAPIVPEVPPVRVRSELEQVELPAAGDDPFSRLEQQLRTQEADAAAAMRAAEDARLAEERRARETQRVFAERLEADRLAAERAIALRQERVVSELEQWLAAIVGDRGRPSA